MAGSGSPNVLAGGTAHGDPLQQAILALNAQRPADAQRIAEEVLRRDPRQTRASHILGCALLMQNRPAEAIAPLQAAARGRHDAEIETRLAMALAQSGRESEAVTQLKRAVKRQPPYAPAFHGLCTLLAVMERYDEAAVALRRGAEVAPMMPDLSIALGNVLLQRKDHTGAKAVFRKALAIAPASADALFGIGKAHYDSGENETAAEYFRQSIRSRPDDYNAWLHLGHCLLNLGQRDDGYECFRTAARGDARRFGRALSSLVASGRGRAWLRPSEAVRFLRESSGKRG